MKGRVQIFSVIIAVFSILCWLQSCDGADFTNNDVDSLVNNDKDLEDSEDLEEVETQEPKKLTADEIQEEINKIFENPTILNGKKVKVCMTYIGRYNNLNGEHYCDKALFNVFFNGSTIADSKQLNLNNGTCRDVTLLHSNKTLTIGHDCSSTVKKEMKALFGEEFAELHLKNKNNHVPGVLYENAKWKDGAVDIKVACVDKNKCEHNGALISLSMISEVKLSDGTKKYISAERVTLPSDKKDKVSMKSYKLKEDFASELLDKKPEFDDYCGIIKK